ncbi:choline transporter-like protein 1 [Tribolium madens]|uniref:choline transporter-like protein 1 n=1 Tax=Tribolium madens TaxID=41895 RepID=UPI001CF76466|nr:choline transporter-like protein 1 [Tribolium madens]
MSIQSNQRETREPQYKKSPVEPIHEFRHLDPSKPIELPETASNRKCTDVSFLLVFQMFQIVFIISSVYIACVSDLRIGTLGTDGCKNTCGMKNVVKYNKTCPLEDYTYAPFELKSEKKCVSYDECRMRNMTIVNFECLKSHNLTKSENDYLMSQISSEKMLLKTIIIFVITPIIASVLSILVFASFRKKTFATFYFFAILSTIIFLFITPALWYAIYYLTFTENYRTSSLWYLYIIAVICTVVTISLPIIFFWRRRKTKILIQLYREATPAIFKSHYMLVAPLLATLVIEILAIIGILMYLYAQSVKIPQNSSFPIERTFYVGFMCFMAYWIFTFSIGCQNMMTAGAIASYYFSRDKNSLKNQYLKYAKIVVRYHLGTIAGGSLIITVLSVVKFLINQLRDHSCGDAILDCFCECMEEFLHYISVKAYIMTAIHGRNFLKSGKRAVRMMWIHFLDLIQVDGFNAVAMFSAGVIIVLICLFISCAIIKEEHVSFLLVTFIGTLVVAGVTLYFFFSLISISIATVFLCYCEDRHMHDGTDQPYFMSPQLEAAVNEALEFAAARRAAKGLQREQNTRQIAQNSPQNI